MPDGRSGSVRPCLRSDSARSIRAGRGRPGRTPAMPPALAAAVACRSCGSGRVSGRTVAMSAAAAAGPRRVLVAAGPWQPDTPSKGSDRRGHQHGHRFQPVRVRRDTCRPDGDCSGAADGQSAARSGSFRLPPPCLKGRLTCGEPTLQEPTSPAVPSGPGGGAAARLRRHGHQFRRPWPRALSIMARLVEAAEGSMTPLLRRPVAPQPACRRLRRQLRRMRGKRKARAAKLHLPFPLAKPTRSPREPRAARADRVEAPTSVRSGSEGAERLPRWLWLVRARCPAPVSRT